MSYKIGHFGREIIVDDGKHKKPKAPWWVYALIIASGIMAILLIHISK